jgi:Co/Zn/Cd efflux system component
MFKIAAGVTPSSRIMLSVTMIALIANLACLVLLWRFRNLNVNMSSTFECSQNDVLANVGVIVAGLLVAWTGAAWPDILVGFIIAVLFVRSAFRVLRSGWPVWRGHAGHVQFE